MGCGESDTSQHRKAKIAFSTQKLLVESCKTGNGTLTKFPSDSGIKAQFKKEEPASDFAGSHSSKSKLRMMRGSEI